LLTVQGFTDLKNTGSSSIDLEASDLTDSFRLRFDSDPDIERMTFGSFDIQCIYTNNNVKFSAPGQSMTVRVNGT
jgi:hypothetical protein